VLIIQTIPDQTVQQLQDQLKPNLQLHTFPAPDTHLQTGMFAWEMWSVAVMMASGGFVIDVALAQADNRAIQVLLQTTADEHDTLYYRVCAGGRSGSSRLTVPRCRPTGCRIVPKT
jgi:hypothetical protein